MLVAIGILSTIPIFGYYLSFIVELNNCPTSYDSTNVTVSLVLAVVLMVLLLVLLVLLFLLMGEDSEE